MKLSGWGRFPVHQAKLNVPRSEADVILSARAGHAIARGNGRAYGDSAVSSSNTVDMRQLDRLISFDESSGQVVAEAGVILADVIDAFLPLGWFPAVTPGTKYVTLGGMIAADVHGKNHHKEGSFSNFVDWIDVVGADGEINRCSRTRNASLFAWTLGGMGLTGIITRAAFRLRRVETAWISQTTLPARNVDEAITHFEAAENATYSVAWIDCLSRGDNLGRSLIMLGEHCLLDELDATKRADPLRIIPRRLKSVPFDLPAIALNRLSVRAFNELYFRNGQRLGSHRLIDWDGFFYPLDAILGWNRIYGRRGFAQFQCVMPLETSRTGIRKLLEAISASGTGSFLAVLKRLGDSAGGLSFPMKGFTLALDFPVSTSTLQLLQRLDEITLEHGGRFYLAKDSRMTAQTLRHADSRVTEFVAMRSDNNLRGAFRSEQSERLDL
jgi:FAD/FMN-containing dehydrogenase